MLAGEASHPRFLYVLSKERLEIDTSFKEIIGCRTALLFLADARSGAPGHPPDTTSSMATWCCMDASRQQRLPLSSVSGYPSRCSWSIRSSVSSAEL